MDEKIHSLIKRFRENDGNILSLLQDTQEAFGYIPEEAVDIFSKELNIPASNFYGVSTFYSQLHLNKDAVQPVIDDHIIRGASAAAKHSADDKFHGKQTKVLLSACGKIDPEDIEAYKAVDGYSAIEKVVTSMTPEQVIEIINKSGLRGRGGSGYPVGAKWEACRNAQGDQKYIICNAYEGDPAVFKDRAILAGNPHSVIEAMAIGAYAIGATRGYIYVGDKDSLAVQRLKKALAAAQEKGCLGTNLFSKGFDFDIRVKNGAGCFVCGEETALIESIEGHRGMSRSKPVFPVQNGLWGKPTVVNNIETLANIPYIINKGPEWFSSIGTENSKGTKLFSLIGKVKNTGLIEVPMGTTLREVIYDIGGGMEDDRKLKAVHVGGPLGSCFGAAGVLDVKLDYESLEEAGSIFGSGGIIVLDEDSCMVDMAKFFLSFTRSESCGKCVPCRIGTKRLLDILDRITKGSGKEDDIDILEKLGKDIKAASLCGLGQEAPNPVLSTIKYFRDEYEAHIRDRKCPAGVCNELPKGVETVLR